MANPDSLKDKMDPSTGYYRKERTQKDQKKEFWMTVLKSFVLPFVIIILTVIILGKYAPDTREHDTQMLQEEGVHEMKQEI